MPASDVWSNIPITTAQVVMCDLQKQMVARGKTTRSHGRKINSNASTRIRCGMRKSASSEDRKTMIVAGFAIEVVVLHAALQATREGFQVIVSVDVCGEISAANPSAALEHMRRSGIL